MDIPKFKQIAVTPTTAVAPRIIYGLGEDGRVYVYDFNYWDVERGWRIMPNTAR